MAKKSAPIANCAVAICFSDETFLSNVVKMWRGRQACLDFAGSESLYPLSILDKIRHFFPSSSRVGFPLFASLKVATTCPMVDSTVDPRREVLDVLPNSLCLVECANAWKILFLSAF